MADAKRSRQDEDSPSSSSSSSDDAASSSALIPGLPDDLATLCLARVPSLSCLCRVCPSWQRLISHSRFFHDLRSSLGLPRQQWLYALLHTPASINGYPPPSPSRPAPAAAFSWHAFDPLCGPSGGWHTLPAMPYPVDFQLTSPSIIGHTHAVQCASSATKLFMVAGSRLAADNSHSDQLQQDGVGHGFRAGAGASLLEPALDRPLVFDTQSQRWSQGAPFRAPRRWCACGIAAGEQLLVASGCGRDWDLGLSKAVEIYDPQTEVWRSLQDLKSSKFSGEAINAVNYGGRLHMVSGKGVFWKVGVIYDPKEGAWSDMAGGMRRGWTGPCVVVDGRLLVLDESAGKLKAYDDMADGWSVVMEDDRLKNMEQLINGGSGRFCGVVRAAGQPDCIRIVDIRHHPLQIIDLAPPFGKVVALQLLSSLMPEPE